MKFESTHPCPKLQIQHCIEDPQAVGFVPIIAPHFRLPDPGITVAGVSLTGLFDDVRFFSGSVLELSGEITKKPVFDSLALVFMPIARSLPDSAIRSPRRPPTRALQNS
jgi:hypothetical protein